MKRLWIEKGRPNTIDLGSKFKEKKKEKSEERERKGRSKAKGKGVELVKEHYKWAKPLFLLSCRCLLSSYLAHSLPPKTVSLFSASISGSGILPLFSHLFLLHTSYNSLMSFSCFLQYLSLYSCYYIPKGGKLFGFLLFLSLIFLLKIKKLFFWMGFCCYFLKSLHFTCCPFCFLLLGFLLSWICSVQALFFYINLHGYIRTFQLPFVFEKLLILTFVCVVFSMISEIGFQIIWLGWDS